MSPYNAYSSSLSSSRLSTYSPSTRSYSGSSTYSTLSSTSSYRYKPPLFSSTLSSSKYRTSFSSPSTYVPSTLTRNVSSSSLTTHVPKFNSVSSYTSAILNTSDYKWRSPASTPTPSSDLLWKSPSLSRRNSSSSLSSLSSYTPERSPRLSLPAYTSSLEKTPTTFKPDSWSNKKATDAVEGRGARVGLNNLGNTCFMNAVLQCLCHTQPLVEYCTQGRYLSDINVRSPTHGDLVKVFAEFVKKLIESTSTAPISPFQLRSEVQRYAPRFLGNNQQDAQEFLRYLLHGIHDDINRVINKPSFKEDSGGDALKMWRRYKDTDDSLIVDLFGGQLKSTLKCMSCNKESITYDPFWDLSLPIPEGTAGFRNSSLRDCFRLFSAPEFLDGNNRPFCESCNKKTRSSKKIEVNKFPKVLVIHLKRFSASSYGRKLSMMIDCPMILGNISEFAAQNSIGENSSYFLYGVVDHDGTNNSGHYIAKCRSSPTSEWNEFNDSRVSKPTSVVTSKSYILFYLHEGSFH